MQIDKYIDHSNRWLEANRTSVEPINKDDVIKRLKSKGGLLSIEADSKTTKGSKAGYLTGILYLAPHTITGFNVCPFAVTCIKDCLFNAGRGSFGNVTKARIIKTLAYLYDPKAFTDALIKDIRRLVRKAEAKSMRPVVRLNGTSDLLIERAFKDVLERFKDVQFYDYTKNPNRFYRPIKYSNYDLTFSYDGVNTDAAKQVLDNGGRVAVVFKNGLPATFLGHRVINGDSTDLRFLDEGGIVVGLNAKGSAKKDNADELFVVDSRVDSRCA